MAVPQLDKLKGILNNSGIQLTNAQLYQVINSLIDYLRNTAKEVTAISSGSGSGGGGIFNQPYLTHQPVIGTLPQSRQLLPGTNVNFDDSVFGERTVDVDLLFIELATFLTVTDESASFPNSRQVLAGTNITFDDTVPNQRTINSTASGGSAWSVLTNGDEINPELIFSGGDVIMVET